jgi:hypothetical protein
VTVLEAGAAMGKLKLKETISGNILEKLKETNAMGIYLVMESEEAVAFIWERFRSMKGQVLKGSSEIVLNMLSRERLGIEDEEELNEFCFGHFEKQGDIEVFGHVLFDNLSRKQSNRSYLDFRSMSLSRFGHPSLAGFFFRLTSDLPTSNRLMLTISAALSTHLLHPTKSPSIS